MVIKNRGIKLEFIFIFLVLLVGLFAVSVIAQDNASVDSTTTSVNSANGDSNQEDVENSLESDNIEIVTATDEGTSEDVSDSSNALSEVEDLGEDINAKDSFGITRVTIGEGFIIKDDESNAEFFRGVWVVRKFVENVSNLDDLSNANIRSKKVGYVVISVGDSKEKFKIKLKDFEDNLDKITFDLIDRNGNDVGDLNIEPKRYDRITLWFGTLTIDEGSSNYAGEWKVTAASKTKIIRSKIERPSKWNIFAFRSRRNAKLKENIQEKLFKEEGFDKNITRKELKEFDDENKREHIKVRRLKIKKEIRENKEHSIKERIEKIRELKKESLNNVESTDNVGESNSLSAENTSS